LRRAALHVALVACAWPVVSPLPAVGAKPPNPCLDPVERARLRCPDFTMSKPFGLVLDPFIWPGHVVLRAGNSLNSVGRGPVELHGNRIGRYTMRGRQRIYKRAGGRIGINTGARLLFKLIPGQTSYWKYLYAARFDLWRVRPNGERGRHVRRGPKVSYCLRDLKRTNPGLPRSPSRMVYPACNTSAATRKVTLGTSIGWSDVYPPSYHEQWIDVTGLRGCFDYVHKADPRDGIYESNERNNSATVRIRLPFEPGPQRCPGPGAPPAEDREAPDPYY
jgi:Lysyl oxidase